MKVIDLLNKIANGEEVPEEIKYNNHIFIFDGARYTTNYGEEEILDYISGNQYSLNQNIQIIEELKKIEKIKTFGCNVAIPSLNDELVGTDTPLALELVICKLNEIIDYINKDNNNK